DCSGTSRFSASATRSAYSTAFSFSTGSEPGNPRHTGQMCVFGSPPNSFAHPQNSLVAVDSSQWTSSPTPVSQSLTLPDSATMSSGPDPNLYETHYVEVRNGVTIAYARAGHGGTPLLLLHGYPETKRIWWRNIGPLAEMGFDVIAPDFRGHGDSSLAP